MWLTGRLVPDHKTIADFRKDNGSAIRKVCARFVLLSAFGLDPFMLANCGEVIFGLVAGRPDGVLAMHHMLVGHVSLSPFRVAEIPFIGCAPAKDG
jgi:hypothetical protein